MSPLAHHRTPSGWFDDRLMEAYDLIDAVVREHSLPHDRLPEIAGLLPKIEEADDVLGQALADRRQFEAEERAEAIRDERMIARAEREGLL